MDEVADDIAVGRVGRDETLDETADEIKVEVKGC